MPATYDAISNRWRPVRQRNWTGSEWSLPASAKDDGVFTGSLFDPYIAKGTVLTREVRGSSMPLTARSAGHAEWMAANINAGSGFGPTSINTSGAGTHPIAVYVVDSTAPHCEWQFVQSAPAGAGHDQALVTQYCVGPIPLPAWVAAPSQGDRGLALYDLGTGIMREYFYFQQVPGKPGNWTATTAGVSLAKPDLADLPLTNPGVQLRTGSNAVVGMHNTLGFLGIAELLHGEITHAVAFTCANMGKGYSWPARGGDGISTDPDAPVEGQWCRLPEAVDPDYNPITKAPYNPLTRLIIKAFKRYGGFASDKNLLVHAFNGEHGGQWKHLYGSDPWARGGILEKLYGGTWNSPRSPGFNVNDFPWHLTEWAPVDWGRPNPDFWLRPGESQPWTE
ncbi:hypothetical protein [Sinomonas humi]|uniref:hypothetical protein n=1 Tax=Sinomonas humi TaxID=1338436 RepID=UPI0006924DFA|nr:hypothetical protein [Sinomonas humi]